ncbi:hypothetical protein [Sphingomonas rhizophila]|nr:hypothetical protein [Sphingomonas rhizophila]
MNAWPFVIAAYAVVVVATAAMLVASWTSMRRAEADADAVKRR